MISFLYLLVGFFFALYNTYTSKKEGMKDTNSLLAIFFLTLFFWPFLFAYFYWTKKAKAK